MKINIHAFLKQFEKEYEFLYENMDRVAGYDEAVAAFDEFIRRWPNGNFVAEFCRYRGDMLTSDREAAAFMFALEVMTA